jgi:hypothetical protein
MIPASACFDAPISARIVSCDTRAAGGVTISGALVILASPSDVELVDSLDFCFAKAALMSETIAEAFFGAMMDRSA